MSDELKPKSFRISEETADKFKEVAAVVGGNQQETLAKLIETFEFQSGKAILSDKKADIDQFEKYVTALTRMYMGSLEDNQNVTEMVRTEFEAMLISKDATIQELQGQLTVAKQLKEESTSKVKTFCDENIRLNAVLEDKEKEYTSRMNDLQDMLGDKDNLNKALTDSCNDLKKKLDDLQNEHNELLLTSKNLLSLQNEHDELLRSETNLKDELKKLTFDNEQMVMDLKAHEADALLHLNEQSQLALEKAIFEIERKYQSEIQEIKEKKQIDIDKYQQKYLNLLEKIQNQNNIEDKL